MPQRHRSTAPQQGLTALTTAPGFTLLALTLVSMASLPVPGFELTTPFFPLIAIYFFTSWQPRYLSYWMTCFCGLIYDAFQPSYFGTYALLCMFFRFAVAQLRYKKGFEEKIFHHSAVFLGISMVFFVIEWLLISVQLGFDILTSVMIQRDVLTILLYPLLHFLLSSMIIALQTRS